MFKCNFVTIIIFNLLQSYSKTIVELINSNALSDISNMDEIKINIRLNTLLEWRVVL